MRQIVIGFSRPSNLNPISRAIMWLEGTKFSHCYVCWYSGYAKTHLYYHASIHGLNFMSQEIFAGKNKTMERLVFDVTDEQRQELVRLCIDNSGLSYGYLTLLGMGLVRLASRFGIKLSNPLSDKKSSYICTEWVGNIVHNILKYDGVPGDLESIGLIETLEFTKRAHEVLNNVTISEA